MMFYYQDHKRTHEHMIPRVRYRLKEMWIIAILLSKRWTSNPCDRNLLVNVSAKDSMEAIARCFAGLPRCRRAVGACQIRIISSLKVGTLRRLATLPLALSLSLLTHGGVITLLSGFLAMKRPVGGIGIFCDSHLSGYLFAHAARRRGIATWSLQHGLYRADDPGSEMALLNQCTDEIFIWDEPTAAMLAQMGRGQSVRRAGQYKYPVDYLSEGKQRDMRLIGICPPYDEDLLPYFLDIADTLSHRFEIVFSLHPSLRHLVGRHRVVPIPQWERSPAAVICGDSGVILDCLVRNIPIVAISDRPLVRTRLSFIELDNSAPNWSVLFSSAAIALKEDLTTFGFSKEQVG